MIECKTKACPFEFWSFDWGKPWRATAVMTSNKTLAYVADDEIKVVPLAKCFLTQAEAHRHLASQAMREAMTANTAAVENMTRAMELENVAAEGK